MWLYFQLVIVVLSYLINNEMDINKEELEKLVGYEISYFKVEYIDGVNVSIHIVPKQSIEFIDVKFTTNNDGVDLM